MVKKILPELNFEKIDLFRPMPCRQGCVHSYNSIVNFQSFRLEMSVSSVVFQPCCSCNHCAPRYNARLTSKGGYILLHLTLTFQNLIASVVQHPREIFGKVRDLYSKYNLLRYFIFIVGNWKWDIYSGRFILLYSRKFIFKKIYININFLEYN